MAKKQFFDFDTPWFRPLWKRLAVVGVALGWGLFEAIAGDPGFAILFLAMGGYAAYRLFITFTPREDET